MDFFNDIGRKFSHMARSVTEKTREGVESTRLYGDLRSARNELEQMYCEFGKLCFDIRAGRADAAQADIAAQRIEAMLERIRDLEAQRDDIRSVKRCPACGSAQAKDARFCSGCGLRLPEATPRTDALPEMEGEYCSGCGALRENNERFCPVCGKGYEASEEPENVRMIASHKSDAPDAEEPDEESTME